MDDQLIHLLKQLSPLLIFVVLAIFASGGNKKKRQQEQDRLGRQSEEESSRDADYSSERASTPTQEGTTEVRDSIDEIMRQMGLPIPQREEPRPVSLPPKRSEPVASRPIASRPVRQHSQEENPYEVTTDTAFEANESEAPVYDLKKYEAMIASKKQSSANETSSSFPGENSSSISDGEIGARSTRTSKSRYATLQHAIIWKEILDRPKALQA